MRPRSAGMGSPRFDTVGESVAPAAAELAPEVAAEEAEEDCDGAADELLVASETMDEDMEVGAAAALEEAADAANLALLTADFMLLSTDELADQTQLLALAAAGALPSIDDRLAVGSGTESVSLLAMLAMVAAAVGVATGRDTDHDIG